MSVEEKIKEVVLLIKNLRDGTGTTPALSERYTIAIDDLTKISNEAGNKLTPEQNASAVAIAQPVIKDLIELGNLVNRYRALTGEGGTTQTTEEASGEEGTSVLDQELAKKYQSSITLAEAGDKAEGVFYTNPDEYERMFQQYKGGFNDLKTNAVANLKTLTQMDYSNDQLEQAKSKAITALDRVQKIADGYYDILDTDFVQADNVSGKNPMASDESGSFAAVSKQIATNALSMQNKIRSAKNVTDFKAVVKQALIDIEGLNTTGPWSGETYKSSANTLDWKTGGKLYQGGGAIENTFEYKALKNSGYSDNQIKALLTKGSQTQSTTGTGDTQTTTTSTGKGNDIPSVLQGVGIVAGLYATSKFGKPVGKAVLKGLGVSGKYVGDGAVSFFNKGKKKITNRFSKEVADKADDVATTGAANTSTGAGQTAANVTETAEELGKKKIDFAEGVESPVNQTNAERLEALRTSGTVSTPNLNTMAEAQAMVKAIASKVDSRMFELLDKKTMSSLSKQEESELIGILKKQAGTNPQIAELLKNMTTSGSPTTVNPKFKSTVKSTHIKTGRPETMAEIVARAKNIKQQATNKFNSSNPTMNDEVSSDFFGVKNPAYVPETAQQFAGSFFRRKGGRIYNDGGKFSPIFKDKQGVEFKVNGEDQIYYNAGDGVWTMAEDPKVYAYAKQIIISQAGVQEGPKAQTQEERQLEYYKRNNPNYGKEGEDPTEDKGFIAQTAAGKNEWVPFVGGTMRRDWDWLDTATAVGGFLPGVGGIAQGIDSVRNLYDEYEADDLDWQDVARNAAEIGVATLFGKGVSTLSKGIKKANQIRKMGKVLKFGKVAPKGKYGMKVEKIGSEFDKPIIDPKSLLSNKKYQEGGVNSFDQSIPVLGKVYREPYNPLDYAGLAAPTFGILGKLAGGVKGKKIGNKLALATEVASGLGDLYDEYQAGDLDYKDVVRNAGEVLSGYFGGRALSNMGKSRYIPNSMGVRKNVQPKSEYLGHINRVNKEATNFVNKGVNAAVDFKRNLKGFNLPFFKKGGAIPTKVESVSKPVKSVPVGRYDYLSEFINMKPNK